MFFPKNFIVLAYLFIYFTKEKENREQEKEEAEVGNVRGKEIAAASSLGECQTTGRPWKVHLNNPFPFFFPPPHTPGNNSTETSRALGESYYNLSHVPS